MLERLLVITTAILRASAKTDWDIETLNKRLNLFNAHRMAQVESLQGQAADNAADKARAELIHFFGRIAEAKVRTRL